MISFTGVQPERQRVRVQRAPLQNKRCYEPAVAPSKSNTARATTHIKGTVRSLFGSAGPDVVLDVRLPGLSSTSLQVKMEPSTFHRLQSQAIVPSSPIDLDETPPRKKKASQAGAERTCTAYMPTLTMDVISLLSGDENPGPLVQSLQTQIWTLKVWRQRRMSLISAWTRSGH